MTACAGFMDLDLFDGGGSRGAAPEARELERKFTELVTEQMKPVSIQRRVFGAVMALKDVAVECATPGWDGYESDPLNSNSLRNALALLVQLPSEFPLPEVAVDPDGEVSLEWYRSARELFAVSVGSSGKLSYAGVFGRGKVHGTEFWCGEIPYALIVSLERLYPKKQGLRGLFNKR